MSRVGFARAARAWAVVVALTVVASAPAQSNDGAGDPASARESTEVEAYTGPPIFLPEGDPPPPPTVVRSRDVKENFPETETLRFERRVVQMSDDTVLSDGPHREFYASGQLYVSGEFRRGRATGTWTYYHPSGQVAKEVTYRDGDPDGEVKVFNEEGELVAARTYVAGKRDGVWETYTTDGETKLAEERYADGKPNGVFKAWYANGELRRETPFIDGKVDGVVTEYSQLGAKRAEVTFKAGVRDGTATAWRRDGTVIEQEFSEGKLVKRSVSKGE